MPKISFETTCGCGAKVSLSFKAPTRMQHSVTKAKCEGCGSRYLASCEAEQSEKGERFFKVSPTAVGISDTLLAILNEKAAG